MTFLQDVLRRDVEARNAAMERLASGRLRDPAGRRLESQAATAALESAARGSVPPPESRAEAVVLFDVRPSLLIRDDGFELPASPVWRDRLAAANAAIRSAIPSVGRIETKDHPHPLIAAAAHVGTGWLVAENIVVTNRHVALLVGIREGKRIRFWSDGMSVRIDFVEEHESDRTIEAQVASIRFIAEDNDHDFAFLVLDATPDGLRPLILADHREDELIATIGYPAPDDRIPEDMIRHVFEGVYNVKRLAPGQVMPGGADGELFHDASTLKGSSGSVVLSLESGHAVGLHFAGEFRDKNFAVATAHLKARLAELAISIPVRFPVPAPTGGSVEEAHIEVGARDGYDPLFLGEGDPLDLPGLEHAAALQMDGLGAELKYTHFSVVMHAARRLAICAACNIDGKELRRVPRENRFVIDGRVPAEHQLDDTVYRDNVYDRGHLVRRLDPVWGAPEIAEQANADSFFFTNIAPQHEFLNQKLWSELEDYILDNADSHDLKLSVFTGCVFDPADPNYRGAQIPRAFWKIVAYRESGADRRLRASGYLLDQAHLIRDVQESFAFGAFKTYQLSIAGIAARTGLTLAALIAADVVGAQESFALMPLARASDIRF